MLLVLSDHGHEKGGGTGGTVGLDSFVETLSRNSAPRMEALSAAIMSGNATKKVKREGGHMANIKPGEYDPTTAEPPNRGEAGSEKQDVALETPANSQVRISGS